MKKTGNAKFQFTEDLIQKSLHNLLKRKRYDGFSIKELCDEAGINRSTFYAHYQDINDLMIKTEKKLAERIQTIWKPKYETDEYSKEMFVELFTFIKEYKEFYKAFLVSHTLSFVADKMIEQQTEHFKKVAISKGIQYTDAEIDYHIHFFGGGLKAVCGRWLHNDCRETPEQLAKVIYDEYRNSSKYKF